MEFLDTLIPALTGAVVAKIAGDAPTAGAALETIQRIRQAQGEAQQVNPNPGQPGGANQMGTSSGPSPDSFRPLPPSLQRLSQQHPEIPTSALSQMSQETVNAYSRHAKQALPLRPDRRQPERRNMADNSSAWSQQAPPDGIYDPRLLAKYSQPGQQPQYPPQVPSPRYNPQTPPPPPPPGMANDLGDTDLRVGRTWPTPPEARGGAAPTPSTGEHMMDLSLSTAQQMAELDSAARPSSPPISPVSFLPKSAGVAPRADSSTLLAEQSLGMDPFPSQTGQTIGALSAPDPPEDVGPHPLGSQSQLELNPQPSSSRLGSTVALADPRGSMATSSQGVSDVNPANTSLLPIDYSKTMSDGRRHASTPGMIVRNHGTSNMHGEMALNGLVGRNAEQEANLRSMAIRPHVPSVIPMAGVPDAIMRGENQTFFNQGANYVIPTRADGKDANMRRSTRNTDQTQQLIKRPISTSAPNPDGVANELGDTDLRYMDLTRPVVEPMGQRALAARKAARGMDRRMAAIPNARRIQYGYQARPLDPTVVEGTGFGTRPPKIQGDAPPSFLSRGFYAPRPAKVGGDAPVLHDPEPKKRKIAGDAPTMDEPTATGLRTQKIAGDAPSTMEPQSDESAEVEKEAALTFSTSIKGKMQQSIMELIELLKIDIPGPHNSFGALKCSYIRPKQTSFGNVRNVTTKQTTLMDGSSYLYPLIPGSSGYHAAYKSHIFTWKCALEPALVSVKLGVTTDLVAQMELAGQVGASSNFSSQIRLNNPKYSFPGLATITPEIRHMAVGQRAYSWTVPLIKQLFRIMLVGQLPGSEGSDFIEGVGMAEPEPDDNADFLAFPYQQPTYANESLKVKACTEQDFIAQYTGDLSDSGVVWDAAFSRHLWGQSCAVVFVTPAEGQDPELTYSLALQQCEWPPCDYPMKTNQRVWTGAAGWSTPANIAAFPIQVATYIPGPASHLLFVVLGTNNRSTASVVVPATFGGSVAVGCGANGNNNPFAPAGGQTGVAVEIDIAVLEKRFISEPDLWQRQCSKGLMHWERNFGTANEWRQACLFVGAKSVHYTCRPVCKPRSDDTATNDSYLMGRSVIQPFFTADQPFEGIRSDLTEDASTLQGYLVTDAVGMPPSLAPHVGQEQYSTLGKAGAAAGVCFTLPEESLLMTLALRKGLVSIAEEYSQMQRATVVPQLAATLSYVARAMAVHTDYSMQMMRQNYFTLSGVERTDIFTKNGSAEYAFVRNTVSPTLEKLLAIGQAHANIYAHYEGAWSHPERTVAVPALFPVAVDGIAILPFVRVKAALISYFCPLLQITDPVISLKAGTSLARLGIPVKMVNAVGILPNPQAIGGPVCIDVSDPMPQGSGARNVGAMLMARKCTVVAWPGFSSGNVPFKQHMVNTNEAVVMCSTVSGPTGELASMLALAKYNFDRTITDLATFGTFPVPYFPQDFDMTSGSEIRIAQIAGVARDAFLAESVNFAIPTAVADINAFLATPSVPFYGAGDLFRPSSNGDDF